jgi:hypothetical protein
MPSNVSNAEAWPSLPLEAWSDTCATLHMWTQIVGKIGLTQSPWINHSWHVTLYVTARGLTTSPIPYGSRTFDIDFDFIGHDLRIQASDGGVAAFSLQPQSVATFYERLRNEMAKLDLHVSIDETPNEIPDPIPFDQDETHTAYDPVYANRFWRVLVQADRVFKEFRARFVGKCSPVHYFWGAPDLAVTRFSGRRHRNIRLAFPTCRTEWLAKPTHMKSAVAGFGPAGGLLPIRCSIPMPIRSRPVSPPRRSSRALHFTARICENSFCPTTWSAKPNRRMKRFLISCRRRMKQRRIWRTGIRLFGAKKVEGTVITRWVTSGDFYGLAT